MNEINLVWLRDIATLDYVREWSMACRGRRGQPRLPPHMQLVGYTEVGPETHGWNGYFPRRIFWLAPWDRCSDPGDHYRRGAPHEAVDPRTVALNVPGQITPRVMRWGAA
jgi:hypothetical protein